MSTPAREVPLVVGDQTYVLVLDIAAICALEELFSTPKEAVTFPEILQLVMRLSYRHIRGFAWATLRRKLPKVTLAEAEQIIQDVGGVDAFFSTILKVYESTKPDKADTEDRPQRARRSGTGAPSTSTPGA